MKDKTLTIEEIKNNSMEDVLNFYRNGYSLEESTEIFNLIESQITFHVSSKQGPLDQAIIHINGVYKGITDGDGYFTIVVPITKKCSEIFYIVARQGYNGTDGIIQLSPSIKLVHHVHLTDLTIDKGSVLFHVNCLGAPCTGAHIILENKEIGITGPDGNLLAENLDLGTGESFVVRKDGYLDAVGTTHISDRFTMSSKNIHLIPIIGMAHFTTIDNQGNPLSGVQVYVDDHFVDITDNNGEVTVIGLRTDIAHKYSASKTGYIIVVGPIELSLGIRFISIIMAPSTM